MKALIVLFLTGVIALFAGVFKWKKWVVPIALLGMTGALLIMTQYGGCSCKNMFYNWGGLNDFDYENMLMFNQFSASFSGIMMLITMGILLLLSQELVKDGSLQIELVGLMIFSLCGALILVSFSHLVMLFLGIEILSIPLYVMAGSRRQDPESNEASIKYFLMGAFTTGILLFGIALLYGATGHFDFHGIQVYSQIQPVHSGLFNTGLVILLAGLAFKIGLFPFHFWGPDVYTGSPSVITTFMATVVKTSVLAGTFILLRKIFGEKAGWNELVSYMAAATILIGNLSGLVQTSVKRMLAWSGVAHAGYAMMAFLSYDQNSDAALLLYMAAYSAATLAAFSVLILMRRFHHGDDFKHFAGLAKTNPGLAFVMTLSMLSLAGIPVTAGFFAKYFLFVQAFQSHFEWIVIVAVLGSAISIAFYLRVIIEMYFRKNDQHQPVPVQLVYSVLLSICVLAILALGIFPSAVIDLLSAAPTQK